MNHKWVKNACVKCKVKREKGNFYFKTSDGKGNFDFKRTYFYSFDNFKHSVINCPNCKVVVEYLAAGKTLPALIGTIIP